MDWKNLFLSPNGRIKRQDFWVGWIILFAAGFVLGMIPVIGVLAGLAGIYVKVCLYSKRLHDMGRTGWLQLVPYGVSIVGLIVGFAMFGAGLLTAAMQAEQSRNDPAAVFALLGSMGGFLGILALLWVVNLGFLIWVGVAEGQKGENAYGTDPLSPSDEVF